MLCSSLKCRAETRTLILGEEGGVYSYIHVRNDYTPLQLTF